MQGFLQRHRIYVSCAFFVVCSLALATINLRAPGQMDPVGVLFMEMMHPVQLGVSAVSDVAGRAWDRYAGLLSVHERNEVLSRRLQFLGSMARRSAELELANRRLLRLLALRDELRVPVIAARVVNRSPVEWVQVVTLDKGSSEAIQKGMAVMAPEGVVGQVIAVSPHAARVLLVSDPSSGVDALIQRTRVQGIVAGTLRGRCTLKYVQRGGGVRFGDAVITSGLDGIFPKGQPIGSVVRVGSVDRGMFQDVEVLPSAELARLEEVLVVASGVGRAGD